MQKKKFLAVVTSAFALTLAGCTPEPSSFDPGVELIRSYTTTYVDEVTTYDYLADNHNTTSELLVNCVSGLVEFNEYGVVVGDMAESWSSNAEGTEFTFVLRDGLKWANSDGLEYGTVTATDFVTGMQHLLDAQAGLEFIVDGIIKNAHEYMAGAVEMSAVGVEAVDAKTVKYTLEQATPYFMTMLEYSPFLPLNKAFFESKGGALGIDAWATAKEACTYGVSGAIDSILYNGAYTIGEYTAQSKYTLVKNDLYWDVAHTTVDGVTYIYNDGSDLAGLLDSVIDGTYVGVGISNSILDKAQSLVPENIYVSNTTGTCYYGTFNLNRKAFASNYEAGCETTKTVAEQASTKEALLNKNFRKAFQAGFDKISYQGQSRGATLASKSLRNTLTFPELVSLSAATGDYASGSTYVDMVEAEYKKLVSAFGDTATYSTANSHWGDLSDNGDAYYNVNYARKLMDDALKELRDSVTFPIVIETPVYTASQTQNNLFSSAQLALETAFADMTIYDATGAASGTADIVDFEKIGYTTTTGYYYSNFYASTGSECNYDFYYGAGWSPDFADPSTYLNIFGYAGDMMATIGIDVDGSASVVAENAGIYEYALGDFNDLYADAKKELNLNERYVLMAEAEAEFLDSAVVLPLTTEGGAYAITRFIPRTGPFATTGTDADKVKHLLVAKDLLTKTQVEAYRADWAERKAAL